MVKTFMEHWQC